MYHACIHSYTHTSRTQIHLYIALVLCRMCRIARRCGTADQTTSLLLARGDAPPAGKVPSARALPCEPTQRVITGAICSAVTSANQKRASEPHAPELSLIDPLSVAAIYLLQPCSRAHPPTPATARCKRRTGQDATGDAARRERRVGTRRVAGTGARSAQRLAAERRAAFRLVWRGVAVQSGRPRMVHCDPQCHSVGWCNPARGGEGPTRIALETSGQGLRVVEPIVVSFQRFPQRRARPSDGSTPVRVLSPP
jgi:hypothetical protein